MAQLTQLLAREVNKGKGPMTNPGEGNEDPLYPPDFTPPNVQTQAEMYTRRPSVTIRPQQLQAGVSMPMNFRGGSSSSLGDNLINPIIPNFDEAAEEGKANVELPKRWEDRCKWLEEKFKAMESAYSHHGIDAKDLSLVPDLVFMKQYNDVTDMSPDRITLQNMEKKSSESFRQYTQRWREVAIQAAATLGERDDDIFSDIIMNGEMIESAIRNGKIEAEESNKRSASKRKENEVNNVNTYNKSITVNRPRKVVASQQGSTRQESGVRKGTEKPQFTPIPMSYKELYQSLFNAHVVSPYYLTPLQPPYPKCMGVVKFDDSPSVENPLPNHTDKGLNMISENMGEGVKTDIAEVKTPLKWVWKEIARRGLVISGFEKGWKTKNYCEFHHEIGHKIQRCEEFRALVQSMMDNKEMESYKEAKEKRSICTSDSMTRTPKINHPVVIISRPKNNEARVQVTPNIIIQKPATFSYKDSKTVPWNYECNTTIPGKDTSTEPVNGKSSTVEQKEEKAVESEPLVNEPIKEEEAKKFLKFLKHSEYSVVEQLHKQLVRISVLALLLSSEVHRSTLMKVLNETYVANVISVSKLDRLVNNISVDNFIFFSDDKLLDAKGTRCQEFLLIIGLR
ncbi:uncharacterized protein [Gossypium hirsutum]|uniref:Uncharacterized protein n=1 Tax=Gossypium hirsutum TaxID=3635 RepID=A0A1U8KX00_GOSHI|nr:uncharacterized protein LOC107921639 [Gossypium hirsutum]